MLELFTSEMLKNCTLTAEEVAVFVRSAKRCVYHDPVYGGSIVSWINADGHVLITAVNPSR